MFHKRRFNKFTNNRNRFRKPAKKKAPKLDRALFSNKDNMKTEQREKFKGKPYTEFQFHQTLTNNLAKKGFETMTEIQQKTIPLIMQGHDLLGISETGSGKTGAFLIPLIDKLLKNPSERLLIVAPTRELASQITKEAISFLLGTGIYASLIIGGESVHNQLSQLRRGSRIIIGTPGRINDLIKRGSLKTDTINNIVVDEVDKMFDMGFINDIKMIFRSINSKKQSLFFSATHNKKVEDIVNSLTTSFDIVKLSNNKPNKNVVQSVIDYTHNEEKFNLLHGILEKKEVQKAIIFVETKRFVDVIERVLRKSNFKVGAIHGDKRQNVRRRVIDLFKKSSIDFLIATNVAARGIDMNDITHVINFDEPTNYDEYIHRIGRTGRNGAVGTAYTFVRR